VSHKQKGWKQSLNLFSSIFLFFCLCGVVCLLIFQLFDKKERRQSIAQNLQLFLLGLLFLTVISIAYGTYITSKKEFKQRNSTLLQDKLRSILFEVEHKVGNLNAHTIEQEKAYLEKILNKFSNVFYTDINIFSAQGNLIASSASALFNKGIISEKMNPVAFEKIKANEQPWHIQNEAIEKMDYLSAYVPVINKKGDFLAYLNLPYFVQQQAFDKQWGNFLSAILNIYTALFVLLLLASFFIGNWVTGPLRKVKEMVQKLDINKEDQSITYNVNNEIGAFVKVYNEKVKELSEKSAQLADSQKKLAWKEMARQVAHEIKNPLTPMKLNVQHLVRTLPTQTTEDQERLKKFGHRMVEQIEVLSAIASEFSDFAQLPEAQLSLINLNALVEDVVLLNKNGLEPRITLLLHHSPKEYQVLADKNQLIRVLQNFIKNAIQAIPIEQQGIVQITLKKDSTNIVVEVLDNGVGIPEDIKSKIFMPNFTTKSSGKGLGLAMCQKMIESNKGNLGFTTKPGETLFWFSLPLKNTNT